MPTVTSGTETGVDMRSTKRTQMAPKYTISDIVRIEDPGHPQGALKAAMHRFTDPPAIVHGVRLHGAVRPLIYDDGKFNDFGFPL
jgi:hypothetical protein